MNTNLELFNQKTMSSREIAELTGKPHNDVLKTIRAMEPAWIKVNGGNFSLVEYKDLKGEKRPMYELSKTECLYIATKFNDEARAKIKWRALKAISCEHGYAVKKIFDANYGEVNIYHIDVFNMYFS